MQLSVYQECRTAEGWQPVKVASESDPDKVYMVLVNPWGAINENICECLGYSFRGTCKHQQIASDTICNWQENELAVYAGESPEQTPEQRVGMICPKCGGPTKWQVEVEE